MMKCEINISATLDNQEKFWLARHPASIRASGLCMLGI